MQAHPLFIQPPVPPQLPPAIPVQTPPPPVLPPPPIPPLIQPPEAPPVPVPAAPLQPRPIAREHTIDTFTDIPQHYCGPMNQICVYCGARFFQLERNTNGKYTACCNNGKVNIPTVSSPTPAAEEILLGISARSRGINRRTVNTACAMASISMENHTFSPGIPSLLIHGGIYHNLGALTPAGTPPTFLQVYFHDGLQLPVATTEKETILISLLRAELQEHNAYLLHITRNIVFQEVLGIQPQIM